MVTYLNQTSGMWLVWLQERTSKDISLKEIGLHAQYLVTTLGSMANIIEGTYLTVYRTQESSLDNVNKIFI